MAASHQTISPGGPEMPLTRTLVDNATIAAGAQLRVSIGLDVKPYRHLHFHIGRTNRSAAGLASRIQFYSPIGSVSLIADKAIWLEHGTQELPFSWTPPAGWASGAYVLSIPVVAPTLSDLFLTNVSAQPLDGVYAALFATET